MRFEWGLFNGGLHLVYVSENGAGEALFLCLMVDGTRGRY